MYDHSSPPIQKASLIRDNHASILCRVVYINRSTGQTWLFVVDGKLWPYPIDSAELQRELGTVNGRFSFEVDDPYRSISFEADEDAVSDSSATRRRDMHRYELIAPLVTGENEALILDGRSRRELIVQRRTEVATSRQHIETLLRQWYKGGMNFAAVRTKYPNCGAPGQRRRAGEKKLGRPRIFKPGIGINVTDEVRRHFAVGVSRYIVVGCSLRAAYDFMCRLYYSETRLNKFGVPVTYVFEDAKPTLAQFNYYYNMEHSRSARRKHRLGSRKWETQGRAIVGKATSDILGPGDRYHIDATVADVYLVSQFDPRRIVGRPVIYLVVDVFSSMIVGMYVGFEGPSWIGAMMALVNVVTPKADFCRRYGIEIEDADWPARWLSQRLQGDCGELKSTRLGRDITNHLRVSIQNTASGRPDLQAMVERRFGLVQSTFKEFTPGYVKPDFGERGTRDYRLDAALTLPAFTANAILAVIEHNFAPITGKPVPPEMITDGLVGCPVNLWHYGIQNISGELRSATVDEVALNVMPRKLARVTAHGIYFMGEYYSCPGAVDKEWFSEARERTWTVEVSYDPRDLGAFYLRNPDLPNKYAICRPIDPNSDRFGKSQAEVEELQYGNKMNLARTESERQNRRIQFDAEMERRQEEAKVVAKMVDGASPTKASRVDAIKQNRADEKSLQRRSEVLRLGAPTSGTAEVASEGALQDAPAIPSLETKLLALLKKSDGGPKES